MAVKWLDEPEAHDHGAASDYLSMLAEDARVTEVVAALKTSTPVNQAAKDILRAAQRVCASYYTDEDTAIPWRLVSWPQS